MEQAYSLDQSFAKINLATIDGLSLGLASNTASYYSILSEFAPLLNSFMYTRCLELSEYNSKL